MSSKTEKDEFKHSKGGTFARLNALNYSSWSDNVRRLLKVCECWNVVDGTDKEPATVVNGAESESPDHRKWTARYNEAAMIISSSCSDSARTHITGIDDPAVMWQTLAHELDNANTKLGRATIYRKFMKTKPTPGRPISEFFNTLINLRNQIAGTKEAISDMTFLTHIYESMPPSFGVSVDVQQSKEDQTVDSVMMAFKEFERAKALQVSTESTIEPSSETAHYAHGGRPSKWCNNCNTRTHDTKDCWSIGRFTAGNKRRFSQMERTGTGGSSTGGSSTGGSSTGGSKTTIECYYCGEAGHRRAECPIRIRGNRVRERHMNSAVERRLGGGAQANITTIDDESRVTHLDDDDGPGL